MHADAVVLDIDGVLVDVADSYRRAIVESVDRHYGTTISRDEVQLFKDAPSGSGPAVGASRPETRSDTSWAANPPPRRSASPGSRLSTPAATTRSSARSRRTSRRSQTVPT